MIYSQYQKIQHVNILYTNAYVMRIIINYTAKLIPKYRKKIIVILVCMNMCL
jgi:hypothetical protein